MKKIVFFIITVSLMLSAMSLNVFAEDNGFSDIKGHWAEEIILKFKDKNIVSGYPDGTFKPDEEVTRAEFAKVITKAFELKEKNLTYDDVPAEAWYAPYIKCCGEYVALYRPAINYGITDAYDNIYYKNVFLPEVPLIRIHMAETLVKIETERKNINIGLPDIFDIRDEMHTVFNDGDYSELFVMHGHISDNVRRMFEYTWLTYKMDIMQGTSDGYFMPQGNVSRAYLLAIVDNCMQ